MSLSSGMIRGCFGAAIGLKTGENEKFLQIYRFEGEPGGRGTARHGSAHQNVAGLLLGLVLLLFYTPPPTPYSSYIPWPATVQVY